MRVPHVRGPGGARHVGWEVSPEEITQAVYDALISGDLERVVGHLHDDVVWYVAPPTPFAGEHVGKDEVRRVLVEEYGPLVRSFERRTLEFVEQSDGRYAGIIEVRADVGGTTISNKTIHVHRIAHGAVVEWWLQPLNEQVATQFWSAVSP